MRQLRISRVTANKPDDLNLIPRILMVEGEINFYNLSSDLHTHIVTCACPQINKCKKVTNLLFVKNSEIISNKLINEEIPVFAHFEER